MGRLKADQAPMHKLGAIKALLSATEQANCWLQRNGRRRGWRSGEKPG